MSFTVELSESLGLCLLCGCDSESRLVGVWDRVGRRWANEDCSDSDLTCRTCGTKLRLRDPNLVIVFSSTLDTFAHVEITRPEYVTLVTRSSESAAIVAGLLEWLR